MSKQKGPVYFTGTVDGICYYQLNGEYYARRKSTLSRKRVKRDPAFALTRKYAELLGQASRVAVSVYRLLPKDQKKIALYRAMTGVAMAMLKKGADEVSIRERLQREAKLLQPAETKPSVARMRSRTGGMNVVKRIWRSSGSGMQHGKAAPVPETLVWTVMTHGRTYQARLAYPGISRELG